MPNPRLAARYAKSLMDLAIEKGQLEDVFADMQWLTSVTKSNPDFVNLLRSPIIAASTKLKIVDAVTKGNIGTLSIAFTTLLINKHREIYLPEIAIAFIGQYKVYKNIHIVRLTTASPISDPVRQAIVEQVKKAGGFDNVELEEKIDESLIGGFVLQVGDQLVDASIAYDLKNIAKQFENNDFIYNVR